MMSERAKKYGAISILAGLGGTIFAALVIYITAQANHVPQLEAVFKTEIKHITTAIRNLTTSQEKTNDEIRVNNRNQTSIIKTLEGMKYRVKNVERRCDEAEKDIKECQEATR